MKPPFRLVGDQLSHDTIKCLEELLAYAKEGRLIGIAFAALYKERVYIVNAAGEAYRNPTFARGLIAELDDELAKLTKIY